MKALLLCKGPGAKLLSKKKLKEYDFIAWANWNNYKDKTINIPRRVDKLYLYDHTYITTLPQETLEEIKKDLKVKSIKILNSHKIISEEKTKKWLNDLCKCWDREYENFESEVNYFGDATEMQSYWPKKPSTGHAALVDLTLNYNFDEIHVAGMDLFSGRQYYFDVRETIVSKGGKRKLENFLKKASKDQTSRGILKTAHPEGSAMKKIIRLVKRHPHIKYTFYSTNKSYKRNFLKYNLTNGRLIHK